MGDQHLRKPCLQCENENKTNYFVKSYIPIYRFAPTNTKRSTNINLMLARSRRQMSRVCRGGGGVPFYSMKLPRRDHEELTPAPQPDRVICCPRSRIFLENVSTLLLYEGTAWSTPMSPGENSRTSELVNLCIYVR